MRNFRKVCLALICTLVLSGCREAPPQAHHSDAALPSDSVYNLESRWIDQSGKELELRSLRGKPQVMAMIYGRCEGACPRIIEELRQVEKSITEKSPDGAGFVLVTMDPEVDTPERLQTLAKEYRLSDRWTLIRGSEEQTRELAALLGVKYRKISDTDYAHSNTISVLSSAGVVAHQKQNLGGVETSARALEEAIAHKDPCCE